MVYGLIEILFYTTLRLYVFCIYLGVKLGVPETLVGASTANDLTLDRNCTALSTTQLNR